MLATPPALDTPTLAQLPFDRGLAAMQAFATEAFSDNGSGAIDNTISLMTDNLTSPLPHHRL